MLQLRRLTVVWNPCRLRTKFQRQARGSRPWTADTMDMRYATMGQLVGQTMQSYTSEYAIFSLRHTVQVRRLRTLRRAVKMALPRGLRASPTQNPSDEPGSCNNTEPPDPGQQTPWRAAFASAEAGGAHSGAVRCAGRSPLLARPGQARGQSLTAGAPEEE